VEVRVAPADGVWLSTAFGRDTAYLAFHVFHRSPHEDYFAAVEAVMTAAGGRPHWGKLHTRDAGYLRGVYPRFADFAALRDKVDPDRRFANGYTEQVLGP
jgi:FAD/FMN-containing dehydrogenase